MRPLSQGDRGAPWFRHLETRADLGLEDVRPRCDLPHAGRLKQIEWSLTNGIPEDHHTILDPGRSLHFQKTQPGKGGDQLDVKNTMRRRPISSDRRMPRENLP